MAKVYSGKHETGCHKCGGYPGSPTRDVSKLYQCGTCGFFTCNKHVAGGVFESACPNCGEKKKLKPVMSAGLRRKVKGGGRPDTVAGKADTKGAGRKIPFGGGGGGDNSIPSADQSQTPQPERLEKQERKQSVDTSSEEQEVRNSSEKVKSAIEEAQQWDMPKPYAQSQVGEGKGSGFHNIVEDKSTDTLIDFDDGFSSVPSVVSSSSTGALAAQEKELRQTDKQYDIDQELLHKAGERRATEEETQEALRALAELEELMETKNKGQMLYKSFTTDAYFRLAAQEGVENCKKYLAEEKPENFIGVVSVDASQDALLRDFRRLIKDNLYMYGCIGYGPKSLRGGMRTSIEDLSRVLLADPKVRAVGEVGLDLHFAPDTLHEQKRLVREQALLSQELKMPLYLTSVKADEELLSLVNELKEEGIQFKGVCVPVIKTEAMFRLCLEHNFYVLIRPDITYPENELYRECIKEIGRDRWLSASGDEFSAPAEKRGRWNSPQYVDETVSYLASIVDKREKDIKDLLTRNFNTLFNTPPEAEDDYFTATMNKTLIITTEEILANDTDADGDQLTVVEVDSESNNGSRVRFNSGSNEIFYTPKEGFSGNDYFTYTISDGRGGTNSAKVIINVLP